MEETRNAYENLVGKRRSLGVRGGVIKMGLQVIGCEVVNSI